MCRGDGVLLERAGVKIPAYFAIDASGVYTAETGRTIAAGSPGAFSMSTTRRRAACPSTGWKEGVCPNPEQLQIRLESAQDHSGPGRQSLRLPGMVVTEGTRRMR